MILIIGAAGYIGSHVVRYFLDHNQDCVCFDNLVNGRRSSLPPKIPFEKGDLLDLASLNHLFHRYPITTVINLASFINVGESVINPAKYYQNNLIGSLNLLEVMLTHQVHRLIYSSTCAVFGEPKYSPLDELHPFAPINPYGKTKLMLENIFADYAQAYGLKYLVLRFFNAAGASLDATIGENHYPETHLIPLVLQTIRGQRNQLKVLGNNYPTPDGTCIRDYIHVVDLAQAHYLANQKLDQFSGCLNLGSEEGISVLDLIHLAEQVTGKNCPFHYAPRRPGDPAILLANAQKAKQILNWAPQYSDIETILRTAWQWEQVRPTLPSKDQD